MQIGSGEEAEFRDGCLSLRAGTIAKLRAAQSPGFSGQIPNGLGRQPLSKFRTQPIVGWGDYTAGLKEKGRPVETLTGKGTPGPQYQLDRLTYGQQVQSKFKTAPTPVFGSSQRQGLNEAGVVSPGPMTATVNLTAQPPGPAYSMAGAPWRKEKSGEYKSPGPGQYALCGSLGEQRESTRESFKGFGFGGSGIARDMALPTRYVPGPGHYAWHQTDRPMQPGVKFGTASQRPVPRQEPRPGPCQYRIPTTMGPTPDSRFRTVVAPGFGTPPPLQRPHSATARLGTGGIAPFPGPGHYDVQKVDDLSKARKPLSTEKSCPSFHIRPPSAARTSTSDHERRQKPLDPESLRRAVRLTKPGCRVPDITFGVGPQRPVETPEKRPGPQTYDPESIRRALVASRTGTTRGVKFGTGPQRYNSCDSDKSPGPNAPYVVPSTLGAQANSMFKSVSAPSFGTAPPKSRSRGAYGCDGPGPCTYKPSMSNLPQTTHGITFGGTSCSSKRDTGGAGHQSRPRSSPGPGAYCVGSSLGRQTSSKYKSGTAPSFRAR